MKRLCVLAIAAGLLAGVDLVFAGGETVDLGGFKSATPAGWKMQKPSSRLRKYQFAVPKAEGDKDDADLGVFAAIGGSVEANIERWKMQFIPPEGKTIAEVSKVEKYMVGKVANVVVFDISGTFLYTDPANPKAKQERKADYRRFNVLFDTDNGTFSITLTGPAKTMEKNKVAFDNWIKAFK